MSKRRPYLRWGLLAGVIAAGAVAVNKVNDALSPEEGRFHKVTQAEKSARESQAELDRQMARPDVAERNGKGAPPVVKHPQGESLDHRAAHITPCNYLDQPNQPYIAPELRQKLRNTADIACNGWKALNGHPTPGQAKSAAENGAAGLGFDHPDMLGHVMHAISERPPSGCDVFATPVINIVYWKCKPGTSGNGGPI